MIFLVISICQKWIDIESYKTVTLWSSTFPLPLTLWITRSLLAVLPTWQLEVVAWIISHSFSFITSLLESLRSSWSILLSPLLLSIYSKSQGWVIRSHGLSYHWLCRQHKTLLLFSSIHLPHFPENSRLPLWHLFSLSETSPWLNWSDSPTEKQLPLALSP